jgi:hypothetical protein
VSVHASFVPGPPFASLVNNSEPPVPLTVAVHAPSRRRTRGQDRHCRAPAVCRSRSERSRQGRTRSRLRLLPPGSHCLHVVMPRQSPYLGALCCTESVLTAAPCPCRKDARPFTLPPKGSSTSQCAFCCSRVPTQLCLRYAPQCQPCWQTQHRAQHAVRHIAWITLVLLSHSPSFALHELRASLCMSMLKCPPCRILYRPMLHSSGLHAAPAFLRSAVDSAPACAHPLNIHP